MEVARDVSGRVALDFSFDPNSGLAELSGGLEGRPLAIMLDELAVKIVRVETVMIDSMRLVGDWSVDEAEALAGFFRARRAVPTEGKPIRGSAFINIGRPTIELAMVMRPDDANYDTPSMVREYQGRELRFGSIASFEAQDVFESLDRKQHQALGYEVVDVPAFRRFTREASNREVGFFVGERLLIVATIEGEIPGQGVLYSGSLEGFSAEEWAFLLDHFAALLED